MSNELEELQRWYESQCDGDWEHEFWIRIETLDNPGWRVEIDLEDTPLDGRAFTRVIDMSPAREWWVCEVANGKFRASGGPPMLGRMLRAFLDWAREVPEEPSRPAT